MNGSEISLVQLALALCVGISLSAACGFRVFVPLLAAAVGMRCTGLVVNEHLAWLGSNSALVCLGVATVVEILAYYIPWLDHALDSISAPLAMAAGAVITAGLLPDMPDFARWGIGIVAGAGTAGTVQLGSSTARGASFAATGGLGNGIVATGENVLSVVGSVLALLAPVVAVIGALLVVGLAGWVLLKLWRKVRGRRVVNV